MRPVESMRRSDGDADVAGNGAMACDGVIGSGGYNGPPMATDAGITLWGITLRNLYRQPVRAILTAAGVSFGVAAIVAFGMVAKGFWATTTQTIQFSRGDMMVFQQGVSADVFSTLDEEKIGAALRANPDVLDAVPMLWQVMPVERTPFMFVMGLRLDDLRDYQQYVTEGRLPGKDNEVLIGAIARRQVKKGVGERLWLGMRWFDIVGVFDTEVIFFNGGVVVPMGPIQEVSVKNGKVTCFQVRCRREADIDRVARQIEKGVPGVVAIVTAEQYRKVDRGLEISRYVVNAVSVLAALLGGLIVMNTMWMSVHERTREIGVLRAMGWPKRRIVAMVLIEAVVVGLAAWVIGCGSGALLAELTTVIPMAELIVDPVFDARTFLTALGVAVVLSIVGSAVPAWRAARFSPAEALRYE